MKNRPLLYVIAVGLLAHAATIRGENASVPTKVQAPLFKKILSYDRALDANGEVVVFLVGSDDDADAAEDLVKAFNDVGYFPAFVNTGALSGEPLANSVVYLMPGADWDRVKQFCADNGLLSISGSSAFVEQGHVSVGVEGGGQRPQIVVNLTRLRTEGHELSADLLKLARVVR